LFNKSNKVDRIYVKVDRVVVLYTAGDAGIRWERSSESRRYFSGYFFNTHLIVPDSCHCKRVI